MGSERVAASLWAVLWWFHIFLFCPLETFYPWEEQYPPFYNTFFGLHPPSYWRIWPALAKNLLLQQVACWGFEYGVAVGKFGIAGKKLFDHCLLVDGITNNIFQCMVQLREEFSFVGATIRDVQWMRFVGEIFAAEMITLASFFTAQRTLSVCLGVIFLTLGPRLIGILNVFPLIGGTSEVIRGEHRLGGNGNERVIGDWEVSKL